VWYVEEAYREAWEAVLSAVPPPAAWSIAGYSWREEIPRNYSGYIITANRRGTEPDPASSGFTTVYPGLSRTREYRGDLALALDPWMIYHKHTDPGLTRRRVESGSGGGLLLLPGSDTRAVQAWTAQLVQEEPGVFSADYARWSQTGDALFTGRLFQQGALTYTWDDVWPVLFGVNLSWVYAPLSRVRELPPFWTSVLETSRFPEKPEWKEFALEADMLWALPYGGDQARERMGAVTAWLQAAETQTAIADALSWIPAHPDGVPYNPLSRAAQIVWLSSSYLVEIQ
jgi:hypothetical protein